MDKPDYFLQCVSNVFVKMMVFSKPGMIEELHKHLFDHTQVLASGTVKITVNGEESVHEGPKLLYIAKNVEHRVESLTPAVVLCVHGLRDGHGVEDMISPDAIPLGASSNPIGTTDYTDKPILPLYYPSMKAIQSDAGDAPAPIQTVYIK